MPAKTKLSAVELKALQLTARPEGCREYEFEQHTWVNLATLKLVSWDNSQRVPVYRAAAAGLARLSEEQS